MQSFTGIMTHENRSNREPDTERKDPSRTGGKRKRKKKRELEPRWRRLCDLATD